jgi:hypothetical protein
VLVIAHEQEIPPNGVRVEPAGTGQPLDHTRDLPEPPETEATSQAECRPATVRELAAALTRAMGHESRSFWERPAVSGGQSLAALASISCRDRAAYRARAGVGSALSRRGARRALSAPVRVAYALSRRHAERSLQRPDACQNDSPCRSLRGLPTAIAQSRGLKPDDIWQHPSNKSLREKRQNAELLAPGDVLYVPVVEAQMASRDRGSNKRVRGNGNQGDRPRRPEGRCRKAARRTARAARSRPGTTVACDRCFRLARDLRSDHGQACAGSHRGSLPDLHYSCGLSRSPRLAVGILSRLRQLGHLGDERSLLDRQPWCVEGFQGKDTPLACGTALFQASVGADATGRLDGDAMRKLRDAYGC